MATGTRKQSFKGLVNVKRGEISRELFVNQEIFQQEQEQIFARAWLFVGHESQVPNPGDYFVSCMGEESVILTRDQEGQVHVLLNTCRHRGMKVCRYDEGHASTFTCSYHGWCYGSDGKLVGVPFRKEAYGEQLDTSQWGLIEVAQLTNYKGLIWATWDPAAPPFLEYLGDMKLFLDVMTDGPDGQEGGMEVFGGVHKWIFPANWKFAAENFGGDTYHNVSHRSVDEIGISPSGRKGRHLQDTVSVSRVRVNLSVPSYGHSSASHLLLEDTPYVPSYQTSPPIVEEYFRHAYEVRKKRLGEVSRLIGGVGTVFPNTSFSAGRSIAVWHPRAALKTEGWRWYMVPKGAPQEVKDVLRHYFMRYSGPAGMTEQDDMENWNYASAASKGTIARRYPYNYQQGIGRESAMGRYPWLVHNGLVSEGITEQNQRGFYWRWAEFMEAKGWEELMPRERKEEARKRMAKRNGH